MRSRTDLTVWYSRTWHIWVHARVRRFSRRRRQSCQSRNVVVCWAETRVIVRECAVSGPSPRPTVRNLWQVESVGIGYHRVEGGARRRSESGVRGHRCATHGRTHTHAKDHLWSSVDGPGGGSNHQPLKIINIRQWVLQTRKLRGHWIPTTLILSSKQTSLSSSV